ncbi:DUF4112 domain-containing protein [Hyphomicrobium sp.]|uniref:DUF4112 domain-containing protein n=1 Tax=Hyphomicrobium sp. TaxID=82 RepID=UPI0025B7B001|nr:DUF4112 domain-containing protein [Hyphomicrobium sp.]MCC7251865.1 DUF4112 domain-containing protein [Hyphomicrobium sp.]
MQVPAGNEPTPVEYLRSLDGIDRLAESLDCQFRLPFTKIRFGWDPVLGLIPIAGDLVSAALAIRIVVVARRLGAPGPLVRRMAYNVAIDVVFGAIPLAGTVFDIFFRANLQNVHLLMNDIRSKRVR